MELAINKEELNTNNRFEDIDSLDYQINSIFISDDSKNKESSADVKIKEYKLNPNSILNDNELEKYSNNIKRNLELGNGQFIFQLGEGFNLGEENLGLNEEEVKTSLESLNFICKSAEAEMKIINQKQMKNGKSLDILISKSKDNSFLKQEVCVGLFGEEGSGKSTLLGVLVNTELDNGNGSARSSMFRFQHELDSGKTSNFSHQVIFILNFQLVGFDSSGKMANCTNSKIIINGEVQDNKSRLFWEEVISHSTKLISFYDLGGSEKSLKITVSFICLTSFA